MIGIYQIKNLINDKIYIGSSINIKKRWYEHRLGYRSNMYLQREIRNKMSESHKGKDPWNKGKSYRPNIQRYSKISKDEVLEIRRLYNLGSVTHKELADKFNISRRNIGFIVNNVTWRNI